MNYILIGKPNAGKSSIFNFLTSSKRNIIHIQDGTTRDGTKIP
jgi:Predicted GTPase